jgi:hypothetical protein
MLDEISLPAGNYNIYIDFYDKQNNIIVSKVIENIEIKNGKKTFAITRSAR